MRDKTPHSIIPVRHTRSFLVFAFGFFVLAAQTLLFRDYLEVFEGSELAVGCFFGSWLLWVGVGALLSRVLRRWIGLRFFDLFPLLYIPAFVAEHYLILASRSLTGVAPYELFPLFKMLPITTAANIPVSLLTGLVFTLACEWKSEDHDLPVAGVYMLEALGSFTGGLVITVWLAFGVPAESAFVYAVFVPATAVVVCSISMRRPPVSLAVIVILLVVLAGGIDQQWHTLHNQKQWSRLLPASGYKDAFITPHAKYLYGMHGEQFVVMSRDSVITTLPDKEQAAETAALHLAQKPDAQHVLVAGDGGYGICRQILQLPQISNVTWLHPDPAFPQQFLDILPAGMRLDADERLHVPSQDIRSYLADTKDTFDLAILTFPDPVTLYQNRYYTTTFYQLLKDQLTDDGVIGVSVSGGDNFMGAGLIRLGASVYYTVKQHFDKVVIKPGDTTWMMASDDKEITGNPAVLQQRYKDVDGADKLYPAAALASLYLPDRAAFQRRTYESRINASSHDKLLNTDSSPKGLINALLLITEKSGNQRAAAFFQVWANAGTSILIMILGVYSVIRLLYRFTAGNIAGQYYAGQKSYVFIQPLDAAVLIYTAGLAGMAFNTVLMCMLQAQFGSLFLFVGLVSSLFMLGLFLGSCLGQRLLSHFNNKTLLLLILLGGHIGLLFLLRLISGTAPGPIVFSLFFIAGGTCTGLYFPIAAHVYHTARKHLITAGGNLEMADHIGGASGALVTGVILIPVLGVTRTLLLLALVLAVNAVGVIPVGRQKAGQTPDRFARLKKRYAAAAIAVGLAAAAAGTVWITHTSQNGDTFTQAGTSLPANNRPGLLADEKTHPIQELAADMTEENRETVVETAETPDDKEISYGQVLHRENVEGYLIITDQLVQGITGHHGPIEMAVLVNTKGVIQAVKVIQSNETESYFEQVREWLPNLTGKNIFQDSPFADVDAVTGATDSSRAVLQTLRAAGRKFASLVLEETQTPKDKQQEGVQRLLPESEQGTSRKIDGRPRNVNMKRLRRLIEQGKLSSQEAEWYQKMPEEDEK